MPTAIVNGVRLHFVQIDSGNDGTREDLVAVHGLATNLAFWYLNYASSLAERFRVTLLDLRGHGRSEMPASGYSPASFAGDLSALLDHLRIDTAHYLAHSFGGVVAMRFAVGEPHRVRSLAIADTYISAARNGDSQQWHYGRRFQPMIDAMGLGLDTQDPYFGYRLLTSAAQWRTRGDALPGELAELVGPLTNAASLRTSQQWLALMQRTSAASEIMADDGLTPERLVNFEFPILAMYGEHSQALSSGRKLVESWPHAQFHCIRNAGHFFPATRANEVISHCERFWSGLHALPQ